MSKEIRQADWESALRAKPKEDRMKDIHLGFRNIPIDIIEEYIVWVKESEKIGVES